MHFSVFCPGLLEAQVMVPSVPFIHRNLGGKIIMYNFGPNGFFWHDTEYAGDTFNVQFKWGNNVSQWQGLMAQVAYTQAVTPRVSLGAEAGLMNGLVTPTSAVSVKRETPEDCFVGAWKSHCQPIAAGEQAVGELALHYHRKVLKDRLNLATNLSFVPAAMQATCVFGAEFQLHGSTVSTTFSPTSNTLATVIESKLTPTARYSN